MDFKSFAQAAKVAGIVICVIIMVAFVGGVSLGWLAR
jgi:hypothetical protein